MKAVCITAVAPPGRLAGKFEIRDVPAPTPDKVRVRVFYAAVNIDDLRIAEVRFPVSGKSIRPSEAKPPVPGHDFAGIVDAGGERVTRLKVGDRVSGQASGAWAELCVADVRSAGVLPEGWSPQRAVSYVMGALVARAAIDKVPAKVVGYVAARTLTSAFLRPKYSFAMMPTKPDLSEPPLGEDVEPLIDSEHDFDSDGVAQSIRRVQSHRTAGKALIKIAAEQRSQQ